MSEKESNIKNNKVRNADMIVFKIVVAIIALTIAGLVMFIVMPKAVALVGEEKIMSSEYTFYYNQIKYSNLQRYQQYYGAIDETQFLETDSVYGGSNYELIKSQALSSSAETKLLIKKAKEEGFSVPKGEIESEMQKINENLQIQAEQNQLSQKDFINDYFGISIKAFEKIYNDLIFTSKYQEMKIESIEVDEAELQTFYDENHKSFDNAVIRHILVACDKDAEEAIVKEKKAFAEEILVKVNAGEDFVALAAQYSEDPGSKDKGGMYEIGYGQMVTEFEEWTFAATPNDTGIVKTDFGFHVMKLDSIVNTLDQQKEAITYAYKADKNQAALVEYMENGSYETVEKKEILQIR